MSQWTPRPTIESPCIKVCEIESTSGYCRGCARSLAEIANWMGMGADRRRTVMADLPRRLATLQPKP